MPVARRSHPRLRQFHRKSRNGCVQCKKCRIKCDETTPRCGNCLDRDIECEYVTVLPSEPKSTDSKARPLGISVFVPTTFGPSTSLSPSTYSSTSALPSSSTHQRYESSPLFYQPSSMPILDVPKMALFRHFTETTASTIRPEPTLQKVWTFDIPRLALNCDFLLEAVLALSALHQYCISPPELKHRSVGLLNKSFTMHHNSISAFSHQIKNIDASNFGATLAFISLISAYSFGISNIIPSDYEEQHIDQLLEVIRLAIHSEELFKNYGHLLYTSPLSAAIIPPDYGSPPVTEEHRQLLHASLNRLNNASRDSVADKQVYSVMILTVGDKELAQRMAHSQVRRDFFRLLFQKRALALLIVAEIVALDDKPQGTHVPWYLWQWNKKLAGFIQRSKYVLHNEGW